MTTREQGRRAVRALTTALALAGVVGAGGLGAAAYTGIVEARTTQTQVTTSDDGSSSTTSGASSASSGVGSGSGAAQTGSSGS